MCEFLAHNKEEELAINCFLLAGRLLVQSGASPKSETNLGCAPIWFAASEGHNDVLKYLMEKEHDTYALMDDKRVSRCTHLRPKQNKRQLESKAQ